MNNDETLLIESFGDADVDTEIRTIGRDRYAEDVYLRDTQFNSDVLSDRVFLISGRRGSGKSALALSFGFKSDLRDIVHIEIKGNDAYPSVLTSLGQRLSKAPTMAIPEMARIWAVVLWTVIFEKLEDKLDLLQPVAGHDRNDDESSWDVLTWALNAINKKLLQRPSETADVEDTFNSAALTDGIPRVKKYAQSEGKRIVVTLDTLEKYDVHDTSLMTAVAGLIQFAADFNLDHRPHIQVKVFLPGEIYGLLEDVVLANSAKQLRRPLHLIWTPKDLLRLIAWRLWKHLMMSQAGYRLKPINVRWDEPRDVYKKVWRTYFDKNVSAASGSEPSLSYILRHTQMRPRQLIDVCNRISDAAGPRFPKCNSADILQGVAAAQGHLSSDVLNSTVLTYPNVDKIVDSLAGAPPVLNETDMVRFADGSKDYWQIGAYSVDNFRRLLVDIGVVGRIVCHKGSSPVAIEAEFAYSTPDRLNVGRSEECVVHPMFYRRLNIDVARAPRVMPFRSNEIEEVLG